MTRTIRREIAAMRILALSLVLLYALTTMFVQNVWLEAPVVLSTPVAVGLLLYYAGDKAKSLPRPFFRLVDVSTADTGKDMDLMYDSLIKAVLIYALLQAVARCRWTDDVTHILDFHVDGRIVAFFPMDVHGYHTVARLTGLEVSRA